MRYILLLIAVMAWACNPHKKEVQQRITTLDAQIKSLQDTFYAATGSVQTNRNFVKRSLKEIHLDTNLHTYFNENYQRSFKDFLLYFSKRKTEADSIYMAHLDYVRDFDAFFSDFEELRNQVVDEEVDYAEAAKKLDSLDVELKKSYHLSSVYKSIGDSLFKQNRGYYEAYEKTFVNAQNDDKVLRSK